MYYPATMDGGDVLFTGSEGLSKRTNEKGIEVIEKTFPCHSIDIEGLHLKSVLSMVGVNKIAIGMSSIAQQIKKRIIEKTGKYQFIEVPDDSAANCLLINGKLIVREEYQESKKLLQGIGLEIHTLSNTELAKADGALTCCSVLF